MTVFRALAEGVSVKAGIGTDRIRRCAAGVCDTWGAAWAIGGRRAGRGARTASRCGAGWRRWALPIVACLMLSLPGSAAAQSETFTTTYQRYNALLDQGRYAEAVPLAQELVTLSEQEFGPKHENTAALLYQLALLLKSQHRTKDAEAALVRAVAIYEAKPDAEAAVAMVLADLAKTYIDEARFEQALQAYDRVLKIRRKTLGPDHPDVAAALNDIAEIYRQTGRFAEAEKLYKRSLEIDESHFGPDHPEVAATLNNLGLLYEIQGRYGEAEPLDRRALTIREAAFGPSSLPVAGSLNNLASLYEKEGRYGQAEDLLRRALDISQSEAGDVSRKTASALNNLAVLYGRIGRDAESAKLYRRSVAIFEQLDGPDHPNVATALIGLAESLRKAGRLSDAGPKLQRALDIRRRTFGPKHFETALAMNNMAVLYRDEGRSDEAEQLFKSALDIEESALRSDHPLVATALTNLASLCETPSCYPEAVVYARRATEIARQRILSGALQRSEGGPSEQRVLRPQLFRHIDIAERMAEAQPEKTAALTAEQFDVVQLTRTTAAARSVAGMATRFAAGDDALARLVREQQNTLHLWLLLDKRLVEAAGTAPQDRDPENEQAMRAYQAKLGQRLDELEQKLTQDFPEYAEIARPQPLDLAGTQKLLGPDEAMIVYGVSDIATYIYLVRPDRAVAKRAEIGAAALDKAVAHLRSQLTPVGVYGLADLLDRGYDAAEAYRLYRLLFAPLEPDLAGVHHVFIVPDGALESLPLEVLLTAPVEKQLDTFEDFRKAHWLARRYAMTVLPAVSSLRALRRFAKSSRAAKPFYGFGDPALEGHAGAQRGVEAGTLFRGALADVRAVRRLGQLPDTADELRAIAAALDAPAGSVVLGPDMTEARVKDTDLSQDRILAFATHGVVGGDIKGAAESALVFTPPAEPSPRDDGLLTASEIARDLDLNADLVVLSACNTAAGDHPGAEGLSGLAKAFFYAGSRSLLVSHWPVASQAAVRLTTGMFKALRDDPNLGRAESLRRSILAMIDDRSHDYLAHPLFWAPFVLVGEGGTPPAPAAN